MDANTNEISTVTTETMKDPFAVVGMSFTLPQGAVDEASLWKILESGRNVMTEWPADRACVEGFLDASVPRKPNTLHGRGAHFMTRDPGVFDAPFFGLTAKEVAAMDPQQRWVLEAAYHAFENAGIPVETLRGSRTAVFGASMTDDYARIFSKDPDTVLRQAVTGLTPSALPNRVSWFFDLRGPSVHVDTACSSSMIAVDMACQAMRCGDADAAIVLGTSALLTPETSVYLSNMNFLSPDSRSFSFDTRANGYGRGEGVVALFIKPLHNAIRNGDVIRAVIRMTASNQDGHTPGFTQPNAEAQEALIRHTYAKAGLDFKDTRYFEAHGTGTSTGDPIETKAIGRVFRAYRSPEQPLYVGSVKSNIGHLEGASGLAGIIKSILVLEKGVIPPNAQFEELNPNIDADFFNVQVPSKSIPWPTSGIRRVSVNSFGFGGANSHIILDDAFHYLQTQGLISTHHCTMSGPPALVESNANINGTNGYIDKYSASSPEGYRHDEAVQASRLKLLLWSAANENVVQRMVRDFQEYYSANVAGNDSRLEQLAYTLAARRSIMPWRTFAVVEVGSAPLDKEDKPAPVLTTARPIRASSEKISLAFVFTGQGAQYVRMGLELLVYPVFKDSLARSNKLISRLGCEWSLFDKLLHGEDIDLPEVSQPLCTSLQIAIIELLRSFGITAVAAVGHSSGEIAAAFFVGALSHESACKVAYYRGLVAGQLRKSGTPGAMMSVNLSESDVPAYVQSTNSSEKDEVHVACVNSPTNVTLSGPHSSIEALQAYLDRDGVFARLINTGVAYHSPAMRNVALEYASLIQGLEAPQGPKALRQQRALMVSSVTGLVVAPATLAEPQYWVDNLVSPVRFSDSLQCLTAVANGTASSALRLPLGSGALTDLVEIGPHGALRRPVREITALKKPSRIRYHTVLERHTPALKSTLNLLGSLFCLGYPVSPLAGNRHWTPEALPAPLNDCPPYPFDHSRRYWSESRLSKNYRLRPQSPGFLLGRRAHDFNALQPRWRNWLCTETLTWLGDHVVSGNTVCPGAGMLVMAIEAIHQVMSGTGRPISGFSIKEAQFLAPIRVGETAENAVETDLHLLPLQNAFEKDSSRFEIEIYSHHDGRSVLCFRADIQADIDLNADHDTSSKTISDGLKAEERFHHGQIRTQFKQATQSCTRAVDSKAFYDYCGKHGLRYGESFRLLDKIMWDGHSASIARLRTNTAVQRERASPSPVHPAALDGIIQLILTQFSRGVDESFESPTLVPQRLTNGWISAQPWARVAPSVRLISTMDRDARRATSINATVYAMADDDSVLCAFQSLVLAEVSQPSKVDNSNLDNSLLYGIEWKPQLSSMRPGELQQLCNDAALDRESGAMMSYFPRMERAMRMAACIAVEEVPKEVLETAPLHIRKFVAVIRHLSPSWGIDGHNNEGSQSKNFGLEALLRQCEEEVPDLKLFASVARALPAILCGEIDPLEILFDTKAAEIFYARMFEENMRDGRLRTFLDFKSHEVPNLKVLEVGAGTGGFTGHILEALQEFELRTGASRFAEYVYTDISPAYFEAAREKFATFSDRIVFKPLDIEQDPARNNPGFALGSFDLVVAGSVLHATSNLEKTLANLRKLIKPGGQLVFLEIPRPENACINVTFGSLEGWWLSTEQWREYGPLVTTQRWGKLLEATGYSGLDLTVRDHESDACHISSIMVSTALGHAQIRGKQSNGYTNGESQPKYGQSSLRLLIDPDSKFQTEIAAKIAELYKVSEVVQLANVPDSKIGGASMNGTLVSLLEVGQTFLSRLSEKEFQLLKSQIQLSKNLLWVSSSTGDEDGVGNPHYAAAIGFLRSIRSEENSKHIVTLAIESCIPKLESQLISTVIQSSFLAGNDKAQPSESILDEEFIVRDSHLTIGRMVKEIALDAGRLSRLVPQLRNEPWQPGPPLALEVGTPGMLDSLRFAEDRNYQSELEPGQVEIEAVTWALAFRDIFIALGRLGNEGLGIDCAGVVTRVGPTLTPEDPVFTPGDRIVMIIPGCMSTYPRASAKVCLKIPDSVSFEDAVSVLNPGCTAYHCLINIAHLEPGEKILIHAAAGATGQMAVSVAQMVGAEIFATVGSDDKKELLMRDYGIAEDHIFYSRNASFVQGIKRTTNGYGVDVLLNSLSGTMLEAGWACLAPYGRFIEIGKVDIGANSKLPMTGFAANKTFAAVDMFHVSIHRPVLLRRLMIKVMDLTARGHIVRPAPLHVYPVSRVEDAFRYMQSGKNTGRIVVRINSSDIVPKFLVHKGPWRFDPNASYVVAGGFGGLGRALLRWMADKGAKNLIVPTRSGIASKASTDVVSDLESNGVTVVAPRCDISSATELSALLRDCAGNPPIRGCINCAMVLQDSVFDNMNHAQWATTIASKINTSWNLHSLLPRDMDFFILLSSLAGIYGPIAQSNYAAGGTFQDALARHRTSLGLNSSISLDLGWMRTIGVVAENEIYRRNRENARDMAPVEEGDLLALLDHYCDPSSGPLDVAKSQVLVGAVTPAHFISRGESPLPTLTRRLFSGFDAVQGISRQRLGAVDGSEQLEPAILFQQSDGRKARANIVAEALQGRLARALDVPSNDIDLHKGLSIYGVDSLMAVELRNWIRRNFSASITVFEIMDATSINGVGDLVAARADEEDGLLK